MLRVLKQYYPVRNAVFVVGEGIVIFLSVILASWILFGNEFIRTDQALLAKALLIVIVCQLCLFYNDLYDLNITDTYQELLIRLLQALGATAILLAPVYYLFPVCIIGKWIFNVSIGFVIAFIVVWRIGYTYIINRGLFDQKIILVGSGELADKIIQEIKERKDSGYQVARIVSGKDDSTGHSDNTPDIGARLNTVISVNPRLL
jgi:FlaA1/EpsC-like NDP-sugar epimerase